MKHGLKSLRKEGRLKSRDLYRANVFELKVIPGRSGRDETTDRFKESIDDLCVYLANGGKVPPIKIQVNDQTGDVEVVQGHRRRLAYLRWIPELQEKARANGVAEDKVADMAFVECLPFEGNDVDLLAEISAGNNALALTDVEQGQNYLQLKALGLSVEQICGKVGQKRTYVEARMAIAGANSDVQAAVNAGEVKPTAAAAAVRAHGSAAGAVIKEGVQKAKAEGKKRATGAAVARKKSASVRPAATANKAFNELVSAATELFGMYKDQPQFARLGEALKAVK